MGTTIDHDAGDVIRDCLLVADLLQSPPRARLYTTLLHTDSSTLRELAMTVDRAETAVAKISISSLTLDESPNATLTNRRCTQLVGSS